MEQQDVGQGLAHNVREILAGAPVLDSGSATARQDLSTTWRGFGCLDDFTIGGRRFVGASPWELHPYNDELLFVLDGELEVTLLTGPTPTKSKVGPGCLFVVPKGTWHRQTAWEPVSSWGVTATQHDQISFADDPRF
ncbi:MAG TPA: cupin domain-containing protein [Acidimicrobiales bacterium]|nr:cupin domain-containing protein [Acidimicrobiales bacterium]